MQRTTTRRADKLGLPPGELVHVGEARGADVRCTVIRYDADQIEETVLEPGQIPDTPPGVVTWADLDGLHDVHLVEHLGRALHVHTLVLEDLINTHQRPKVEVFEGHIFVILKMLRYDSEARELDVEQVGMFLGPDYVVTFQEKPGDVFDPVRERLRQARGRIRHSGADYLAYALLDVVVDHYFLVLEALGDQLEAQEDALMENPGPGVLQDIYTMKRSMMALRKAVWPLRESVLILLRGESELIRPDTAPYLRDVYDHAVQVLDTVETYRDILSGHIDLHLSSVSNRMNEVMKVLTIIATLFIPLTFVAGIYGMNFEYMPELRWRWGYLAVWGVMAVLAGGMVQYFRRKNWF